MSTRNGTDILGTGGFAGSYLGARLQSRRPERTLGRLLGLIVCLVATRYIQTSIQPSPKHPARTRRPPADLPSELPERGAGQYGSRRAMRLAP
jgi:hypothetical protein